MTTLSSRDLYPPQATDELTKLLGWIVTSTKDSGGRRILRRALTDAERRAFHERRQTLMGWMTKARYGEIQATIVAMWVCFPGRATSETETAAAAQTYAYALGDLPMWTIKRACDRFQNGLVKPEECESKTIDRNYGPSTAQISVVARAIYRPVLVETANLSHALAGAPEIAAQTPEERLASAAAIEESLADYHSKVAQGRLEEIEREERLREKSQAQRMKRNVEDRRRTYIAEGLQPPAGEDFPSLPLLLAEGYTIEDGPGGSRLLIPPPRDYGRHVKTRDDYAR